MGRNIIDVRGATRRFGKLIAVDGVSLSVEAGEIFALVGPDGAGKTTLLRMLAGLVDPDAGEIVVAGYDARRGGGAFRDEVGYMAQRLGLYGDLTVGENMFFYADIFGIPRKERDDRGRELLQMTRLHPFRDQRAGLLSGGMKQKLALVCTLLHRPAILLLDEPTTGVDPLSRREFWTILYRLVGDGMTVFVTTAYLDEAERANRVGLLYRGRLVQCGTPEALKQSVAGHGFLVEGPALREARARLERVAGVVSVTPFGRTLRLFVAPEYGGSADRLLREAGLDHPQALTLTPISPSLEDVFITHVREPAQAHGLA